ncbi:MAG TPA: hypothetical protein VFB79_19810 [Candidatus Angelobacter sp.]|nr:hypothetical protein [Candidatus Angelobacter sp.]
MKNAFIRILALATLATSVSGFAATNETKHTDTPASQTNCAIEKQSKKHKQTKPDDNSQENKDFNRVLLGIYG